MDNSIKIGKYMRKIVEADSDLMEMVPANKIYALIAHEDTTYPFIVYSRSAISVQYNKDFNGQHGFVDTVQITVDVHGNSYEQAVDVATEFRNALEGKGYRTADGMLIERFELVSAMEMTDGVSDYQQTLVFRTQVKTAE